MAVWIAIDSINKLILGIRIFSFKRPILVTERLLNSLVKDYEKHSLSTDRGTWYIHTLVNSWEDRTSYISFNI
ncbi:MAG: hypothetical protein M3156_05410 [Thermoproteota archaeon]|nr:hypothetical protein [Thermoproteota archaeon]